MSAETIKNDCWCEGSEEFANCAHCFRKNCKKRTTKPVLGLNSSSSLGQPIYTCGRQKRSVHYS